MRAAIVGSGATRFRVTSRMRAVTRRLVDCVLILAMVCFYVSSDYYKQVVPRSDQRCTVCKRALRHHPPHHSILNGVCKHTDQKFASIEA
jgi:hypothetical protein